MIIMDVEFSSLTIFLSFCIFILMLFKLIAMSKPQPNPILNLPPGPRKLPFIGNLNLFASSDPPHYVLRDLSLKYGSLMHLKLGEVSTFVVSSAEAAKQVLKTHDIIFASRPTLLSGDIISYDKKNIAFAPYGEYWKKVRKICTLELLSAKRVQSFRPIREEEIANLCRWIASNAGSPINLTEKVSSTICGIVARASFGKKSEEEDKFIALAKQISQLAAGFHIGDLYPSIKLFRLIGGLGGRVERVHRTTDRILENIINEHKIANSLIDNDMNAKRSEKDEDLVDVLLKFHDAGHELPLTMDNIKAVLMDIFGAGTESSTSTIDFAMSEMLKHPKVLKKAQDEVRQVFDDKGHIDESFLSELKYLKLVIKETFRLHPPGPLLLPRENSEQCNIDGYEIPVKARVFVNAWAIGRDPKYWDEPDSFVPERFLDNSVDYKGNSFEYIPFGAGRRMCPGMSFGLANIELPLAMFLFHFDWTLPDGMKPGELDMTESFGATTSRKYPLHVIPIVKKPLRV